MNFSVTPLTFIIALLMGALSSYIANRREKNPYFWFAIGFLFGLIGLITIFFIPKKKKKGEFPIVVVPSRPKILGPSDKFWYYLDPLHNRLGPISLDALSTELFQGKISPETFVWHEDLPDWKPLQEFLQKAPQLTQEN